MQHTPCNATPSRLLLTTWANRVRARRLAKKVEAMKQRTAESKSRTGTTKHAYTH